MHLLKVHKQRSHIELQIQRCSSKVIQVSELKFRLKGAFLYNVCIWEPGKFNF